MKLTYEGVSADGVVIAETGQYVNHGETVEVDDALGVSLLEQVDSWKPAKAAKAAKTAEKE